MVKTKQFFAVKVIYTMVKIKQFFVVINTMVANKTVFRG